MPSYTIYANADDYSIVSTDGSWDTVRSGGASKFPQAGVAQLTVAANDNGDSTFTIWQTFLHFDTSAVSGTVSTPPILNLHTVSKDSANPIVEAAEVSWSGTGGENYVAGGSLSATYGPTTINSSFAPFALTKTASSISISGTYGLVVYVQRARTNVTPSTDDYTRFAATEEEGTTYDPYLSVTTVTSTNHPGAGAFSGSGTFAGAGLVTRRGSAAFAGTGTFTGSGSFTLGGRAAFAGAGTFTGVGRLQASGQAAFTGSGTLSGSGSMSLQGSASFAGVGTFAAGTAGLTIPGSASFYATSRFIANPRLRIIQRSIGRFPYPARQVRSVAFRVRGSLPSR